MAKKEQLQMYSRSISGELGLNNVTVLTSKEYRSRCISEKGDEERTVISIEEQSPDKITRHEKMLLTHELSHAYVNMMTPPSPMYSRIRNNLESLIDMVNIFPSSIGMLIKDIENSIIDSYHIKRTERALSEHPFRIRDCRRIHLKHLLRKCRKRPPASFFEVIEMSLFASFMCDGSPEIFNSLITGDLRQYIFLMKIPSVYNTYLMKDDCPHFYELYTAYKMTIGIIQIIPERFLYADDFHMKRTVLIQFTRLLWNNLFSNQPLQGPEDYEEVPQFRRLMDDEKSGYHCFEISTTLSPPLLFYSSETVEELKRECQTLNPRDEYDFSGTPGNRSLVRLSLLKAPLISRERKTDNNPDFHAPDFAGFVIDNFVMIINPLLGRESNRSIDLDGYCSFIEESVFSEDLLSVKTEICIHSLGLDGNILRFYADTVFASYTNYDWLIRRRDIFRKMIKAKLVSGIYGSSAVASRNRLENHIYYGYGFLQNIKKRLLIITYLPEADYPDLSNCLLQHIRAEIRFCTYNDTISKKKRKHTGSSASTVEGGRT